MLSNYDALAVVWIAAAVAAVLMHDSSTLGYAVLATPPVLFAGRTR